MAQKLSVIELTGGALDDAAYEQLVRAARVIESGGYLQFIREDGAIGGLFLKSVVRSWHEESGSDMPN